jgi:mono/diheme cytochrome c family protein
MQRPSRLPLATTALLCAALGSRGLAGQETRPGDAAQQRNPVVSTLESLAAGKKAYDTHCAGCHGNRAQGAERASVLISIIQEQGRKQPPGEGELYVLTKSDGMIRQVVGLK